MFTLLKTCRRCKAVKPVDEFPFRIRVTGTRGNSCKTCEAARAREYYVTHHDLMLAKQNARQRQQRAERRAAAQQQGA